MTKEELLVIYLLNFNRYRDQFIKPEDITQKEIQRELNCNHGYLSRLLKESEKKGIVLKQKSRINNKERIQYVYFLTEKGIKYASELNQKIKNQKIE